MRRMVFFLLLLFPMILFAEGERRGHYAPRELGFVGDTSTWWEVLDPPLSIGVDPVWTIVHLFWLDEQGTICKGNPGVNGQPGWVDINYPAWEELDSHREADGNVYLDEEELLYFQTRRYPIPQNYGGLGEHLLLFRALEFRIRSNGLVAQTLNTELSLPIDIFLDETYVVPGYVQARSARFSSLHPRCPLLDELGLPVPEPPSFSGGQTGPAQDSTRCLTRSNVTAEDLIKVCQEGLLRGKLGKGGRLYRVTRETRGPLKKPGMKEMKKGKKQKYL